MILYTEWIGKPGITLDRCTDETIAELGRLVIPMLSSGFSSQGSASLFVLAYHLKAPRTNFHGYVFNTNQSLGTVADKTYHEFPSQVGIPSGCHYSVIPPTGDTTSEAAAYSYIAASLFRSFTKPASSYVNSWSTILNGFSRFYGKQMNVRLPVPNEVAVDSLKMWFSRETRAKVALYRLLYQSNSDGRNVGFKNFLYDNYLLYNGMQIVSIITELADVLKCNMRVIVDAINCRELGRQIKCLEHVLEFLDQNDENHQKKMWRYGRIFDETFLSALQTKSCSKHVYMLAEALRSEAPEKHSGILQMTQLKNLHEKIKMKCVIVAQRLLAKLKSQNPL